jgi:hypothetical protein
LNESYEAEPPIDIGTLLVQRFHAECENALLRRLVLSMALNISVDLMPDDEHDLLMSILDGGNRP